MTLPPLRSSLLLVYLLAVLILGGASAAGYSANVLLQLGAAALIALSLWRGGAAVPLPTGLRPFLLALAGLALVQFVPLPPALWQVLPGRDAVAEGFRLAGQDLPWLSYSLDPWGSLQSLVWWLPALALLLALRAGMAPTTRQLVWLIVGFAQATALLAAVQFMAGSGYAYAITNFGNGVGLFANSNHFGSFQLVAIALAAGQWVHDRPARRRAAGRLPQELGLVALIAPLVIAVLLSQSAACMLLLLPLGAGIALLVKPELRISWPVVGLAGTALTAGMVWLLTTGIVANDLLNQSDASGISRAEFLANGSRMAADFAPFGSGIGTFRELYPWYEDAAKVGTTYVNHAHNDLLELLIETGLPGLTVLGLFLYWLAKRAWLLWNGPRRDNPVALAASLGTVLVLIHSLVDYPLRTAAMSSLVALCCVLIVRPAQPKGALASDPEAGSGRRETMLKI